MSLFYFFTGTFFVNFFYHLLVAIGRRFDYSILGFSIFNFGLLTQIVLKDIVFPHHINNKASIGYEVITCVSIAIMALGLILFTYENFNLKGKKIFKIIKIIFILSLVLIPIAVLISLYTHIITSFLLYYVCIFALSLLYIISLIHCFVKNKLLFERDNLIIVINTTLFIPILVFYLLVTILKIQYLTITYYVLMFIGNLLYGLAISIRLNREHIDLQAINNLLSEKEFKIFNEDALIDKISEQYNLTEKENEVAKLLACGFTNKRICLELDINSESTIKSRVHAVFKKCNVTNRNEFFKLIIPLNINFN